MKASEEKKEEWKKYFQLQEKTFSFIDLNSKTLANNTNSKYIRTIKFVEDKKILGEIKRKLKTLEKEYKKVAGTERLPYNFPVIVSGVENIYINSNPAVRSYSIKRGNGKLYLKSLGSFETEFKNDKKKIADVMKSYKLEIEREEEEFLGEKIVSETIYITYNNLLDLAGADKIQVHIPNGVEYLLNVRKIGENRSKQQRYGYIILDNEATVQISNKQAKRSHAYSKTLEKFEFPFKVVGSYYIKEKKSNQMNMF